MEELNRVLGGGIIKGASILVGGEPGIGKSTLMLQLANSIQSAGRVLYVSGEESKNQIKMRASRLCINSERIEVLNDTSVSRIIRAIESVKPVLIIVDSIQTIHSDSSDSGAGSVSQVKHGTFELNEHVKARSSSIVFIGHVTKEGVIAGPKVVEHIVDTVLYFDETDSDIRILRAVKNRFGATHEIGIFRMCESGLEQVKNPQSLFIEHREGNPPPGVAIVPVFEGSRVLMVEIQSLVVPAKGGISRVFSDRIDSRRVARLAAVLEKHVKLPFADLDIYVNIAGGLRISEVGIDLGICLALYSAKTGLVLEPLTATFGEVSLSGEIRQVQHEDRRRKATSDLGFRHLVCPDKKEKEAEENGTLSVRRVSTIQDAVKTAFIR